MEELLVVKLLLKSIFKLTDTFLLAVKCTKFALLKFKDSRFALGHLLKLQNFVNSLLKSVVFEWANKVLVSSAKIIGAEILFIILGKSFIYKRKSVCPRTEPYGTPCLTLAQFVSLLLFSLSLYIAVLQYLLPR